MQKQRATVIRCSLVLFLIWFGWYSIQLYRQRKELEAKAAENPLFLRTDGGNSSDLIEFEGKFYKRNSTVKAFLCIGVDSAGEMEEKISTTAGQADGIMVVAHNVADDTIKILMIPRDTMTPITLTDLQGNVLGKDTHHITLAYAYGDGREVSCERTQEAVSGLLNGLRIDGYLAMNTGMISVLNDMVGGVTVQIETEGLERADPELRMGATVTLRGRQAEIFVCYRDIKQDHSAIIRMIQQKQYMEKFFNTLQLKAAGEDQLVMHIMQTVQDHMITNMAKDQYMKVALAVINSRHPLTSEDILCIPGRDVTTERFDEFYHDPVESQKLVLELFYQEQTK